MAATIPPVLSVFRAQARVPSQVQDSTQANANAVNNAFKQTNTAIAATQAATAAGTIAAGVLVLVTLPPSAYILITHNLGQVASGFVVVSKVATFDVFQDPADPGCPVTSSAKLPLRLSNQPTQNNPTPTKTIRLQSTAGISQTVSLWIF
jgi:hypothetical protein